MADDELQAVWCSQCGYEYDDSTKIAAMRRGQRFPCPQCGSQTITFGVALFAQLSTSASMVTHKPLSGQTGESIRIDRGGNDPRVAGADVHGLGDLSDEVEGPASPKASSELRTATILVEYLNSHGAQWESPNLYTGKREIGVDAVAEGGGSRLLIQVTTPEREMWSRTVREGRVERADPDVIAAVEAIRAAIDDKKLFSEIGDVVLALDGTDSLRYALQVVTDEFRDRHAAWAKGIGYKEIWMVGPSAALVHRLDR